MLSINKHGLSRTVPSNVKRTIRQRDGFGCVICGAGIYDYEHVDPEFIDAKEHDPDKMTLLCLQCHGKVTNRVWSKQKVKTAMLNPASKKAGFSREVFDIGNGHPYIQFAGNKLINCRIPIAVYGYPLFKIDDPEYPGGPFRLSGRFQDSAGEVTLTITDNEWKAYSNNWDVEAKGPSIIIREKAGKIHLKLDAAPPDGLIVSRLDMTFGKYHFKGDEHQLHVTYPSGMSLTLSNEVVDVPGVGFDFK